MIKEETIKDWIVDEGIFREKKLDDNADFHYIVEFPKDNIMDVVKPREKDFIVIACATQVSPQHLELMNNSSPKERQGTVLCLAIQTMFAEQTDNDKLLTVSRHRTVP